MIISFFGCILVSLLWNLIQTSEEHIWSSVMLLNGCRLFSTIHNEIINDIKCQQFFFSCFVVFFFFCSVLFLLFLVIVVRWGITNCNMLKRIEIWDFFPLESQNVPYLELNNSNKEFNHNFIYLFCLVHYYVIVVNSLYFFFFFLNSNNIIWSSVFEMCVEVKWLWMYGLTGE